MSILFQTTHIKGMTLPNRFVRSATWEGMAADDGAVTGRLTEVYEALAHGGVGLIITSHAYVNREGQAGRWQLGAYDDRLIPGLASLADRVHALGGRIAVQLAHSGVQANPELTGHEPVAPSPVKGRAGVVARAMSEGDIRKVAEDFRDAALRAKGAGFDGVQIHAAHGYLLSQFLSPYYNRRTDGYGGAVENRTRFLLEVLSSIRTACGENYPVLVKMNSEDYIDGGMTVDDMLEAAALLEKAGLDGVEMSGGTMAPVSTYSSSRTGDPRLPGEEVYYRGAAACFKERLAMPLMLVGGIRSFDVSEKLVESKLADYVSFCRPLIREPALINRWKSGDRRRAACVSDNGCFKPAFAGEGIYCVVEKKKGDAPDQ